MLAPLLRLLHADPYGNLGSEHTGARLRKLLSPRYLAHKLAEVAYERRHPDHPWFTREAIRRLAAWLRPEHGVLEWGSGRSTPWLARRCATLLAVEHHRGWYEQVSRQLAEAGFANVDYRLVEEARYAAVADELADGSLDLVVVDGLFRDQTTLRSLPKLRPGGWVVFDNANWYLRSRSRTPHSLPADGPPASAGFAEVERAIAGWGATWTSNVVNDTLLLVKPGG